MNLVKIESKKSVEDRAALEELYLLSSLAKKASRRKPLATQKTRRMRKLASPFIENKERGTTTKFTRGTRSDLINFRDYKANATTIENHRNRRIVDEETNSKVQKRNPSRLLTRDPPDNSSSKNSALAPKPSNKVCFNGLTTIPNRRNQKKKKTQVAPLSECISIDQDEYIRNLLQKKEEYFSHDFESRSTEMVERSQRYSNFLERTASNVSNFRSKPLRIVHSSRSSTMPGFRETNNTIRKKAYSDGIRVARKNSRIKFVETKASRMKRITDCGQSMYMTSSSVPDSLVQFANEIHSVDRITPEEEIRLGKKTQEALHLQHIYNGLLTKLEREPTDAEWCAAAGKFNMEAIAQIIDEGLEAKNKLVTSNLRMVQGVVNVYIRNGLDGQYNAGDLMQEGILVSRLQLKNLCQPSRNLVIHRERRH